LKNIISSVARGVNKHWQ